MIRFPRRAALLATLCLAGSMLSCSSNSGDDGAGDNPSALGPDGEKPLYALLSLVQTTSGGSTAYVNLFDSPDFTSVDFANAREFPGASGMDAAFGKIVVSSGEAPTVTRFGVTDDKTWKDQGVISFANYGTTAPLWGNAFGNSNKAYMTFNVVDRVVWDPSTMTIRGAQSAGPDLVRTRGTLQVRAAYDRALVTEGSSLYWPYYWADDTYYRFDAGSQIAVYDTGTDQIRNLIDAPCPGLDFAAKDENGNLYFSNWVFAVAAPVFDPAAPKTCVVRVKAGETTIDPNFTLRFEDVTQGRQAAAFHVLDKDKAIFAVFHHERVKVEPGTDPRKAIEGANWRFWSFNMATREAKPIEGIDYFAGGYRPVKLDGRTFLVLPRADYATSVAYEILPDGTAKQSFESLGWAYQFVRVR